METGIVFVNKKVEEEYRNLQDNTLKRSLNRAFKQIKENPSVGISLEKYRIPKELKINKFDNVWKYNLPGAWRLIYSIQRDKIILLAIILEWCTHKEYKKKYSGRKK